MKLRDRRLYAQGGLCFFCRAPLPRDRATVEHLEARANGGTNADHNCVTCCEDMNSLLGSRPLKEKFGVILNQKGRFVCPKLAVPVAAALAASAPQPQSSAPAK